MFIVNKLKKLPVILVSSVAMLFGAPYSVCADEIPYGPHEPIRTDIEDFDVIYILAAVSFIVGLSFLIYAYYMKRKLSKLK